MDEGYVDTFKEYVPAEILAAFITINAIVPYDDSVDIYLILGSILILVVFFVVAAITSHRIESKIVVFIVALTLPFWCFMISIERFDNYLSSDHMRIMISVVLVITSLGLTLFARQKKRAIATEAAAK